jgi:hypothetical protein
VARWSRRARALLSAVLATFVCNAGEESTLEVDVRVDPTVQASTTTPAQVLVGFESSGGFVVFRVGFLCAPPAAPFVATIRFPDGGSGSTVDAWLVPVGAGAAVPCGPSPAPVPVAPAPPALVAGQGATAGIVVVGGCGAGETRSSTVFIAVSL